ncbi:cutinase family protein [Gordonia sp. (in: high G+C Gram-positive bacteria)]|uniref:cutinase family protein n=1 Tax=Gordonia sp. (in: high G+C Gram-positive bacteria) TaxID=84139 RepID=UPI003528118E
MLKRMLLVLVTTVTAVAGVAIGTAAPAVAAPGCPDIAVIFARGTAETGAPVGITGLSYENALRNRLPRKDIRVSAVDYPASSNFNDRVSFVRNVVRGIDNAQAQIRATARRCPATDIVVGGYSQGGAVATYSVTDRIDIPAKYAQYRSQAPAPLPADALKHVSAVVLFAPPSATWIRELGAPPMKVATSLRGATATYCIPGDVVCDGARVGQPNGLHVLYSVNGMTGQAADFTARHTR